MSEATDLSQIQACLDRLEQGDLSAWDELFKLANERLYALAREIKSDFPRPGQTLETGDLVNDAYFRLHRALTDVRPRTVRDFFGLAALQMRRVLLDLCDTIKRRPLPPLGPEGPEAPEREPGHATYDPARIAEWSEFHEAVSQLPPDELEVFGLLWYQELSQLQAAHVLGVDESTVKRRWRRAREIMARFIK